MDDGKEYKHNNSQIAVFHHKCINCRIFTLNYIKATNAFNNTNVHTNEENYDR